jgi:hypothetical protein
MTVAINMNKAEVLNLLQQELLKRGATFVLRGVGDYDTEYRGHLNRWHAKGLDSFCDRMLRISDSQRLRMISEVINRLFDKDGPGDAPSLNS